MYFGGDSYMYPPTLPEVPTQSPPTEPTVVKGDRGRIEPPVVVSVLRPTRVSTIFCQAEQAAR